MSGSDNRGGAALQIPEVSFHCSELFLLINCAALSSGLSLGCRMSRNFLAVARLVGLTQLHGMKGGGVHIAV